MPAALPPLIAALLDPARYPHAADPVSCIETHGAWVLLAGEHAYKIKKPVRLPFMDFSTLALRRAACLAEIRVNRRFESANPATHLYRAALPLVGTPEAPRWGRPGVDDDQAIEFAVHMRRFDEAGRLDHLCGRGGLTPAHLSTLAQGLAAFQTRAARAASDGPWGQPQDVLALARGNWPDLRALFADADADGTRRLQALADWTEAEAARQAPCMQQRLHDGRVREGHGDLHLANLALIDGEVVPFDAIEFNDSLRWIDVASDMAFTWMDLLDHGQPGLANWLLCEWLDASGDTTALEVLPFYATYRALVRAKVAAIRLHQLTQGAAAAPPAPPSAEARGAREQARAYVELAQRIAHPPAPQLVITHGLSGSGKTHASSRWLQAEPTGRAVRLRSDVERKRLHGLAAHEASGSDLHTGLYSPQSHTDTYRHLQTRARQLLRDGWTVLVDAAFLRRTERQAFADIAVAQRCPFHILAPQAPLEVLRERIRQRQARGGDASEATPAVLEQQIGWLEPLDDTERGGLVPTPG